MENSYRELTKDIATFTGSNKTPIRVLYDISVLGAGYHSHWARTGVYRVAENIAFGLNSSQEIELLCFLGDRLRQIYESLDYLNSPQSLGSTPIIPHLGDLRYGNQLYEVQKSLYKLFYSNKLPHAKLILKGLIKGVYATEKKIIQLALNLEQNNVSKIDIYHSPFKPIPNAIRNYKKIKHFLTVHDLLPILRPDYFKGNEDSPAIKAINSLDSDSWIICTSNSTRNDLCNYSNSIDPNKVFVTHLAASDHFYPNTNPSVLYSVRRKYRIPDSPYILSLCTLEPRKNIQHIVRCFLKIIEQEKIPDLNLVLVGSKGWNTDDIFEMISGNSEFAERIILTGYVPEEDLAPLYSNALVFVYPSFYEGFGLPALEAMKCGIPVITSNTSSLPEVVEEAGVMLDPKDVDGLCHKLWEIYNQPSLRKIMSQKSLTQAKKFSWEKCVKQTVKAYKVAISS